VALVDVSQAHSKSTVGGAGGASLHEPAESFFGIGHPSGPERRMYLPAQDFRVGGELGRGADPKVRVVFVSAPNGRDSATQIKSPPLVQPCQHRGDHSRHAAIDCPKRNCAEEPVQPEPRKIEEMFGRS